LSSFLPSTYQRALPFKCRRSSADPMPDVSSYQPARPPPGRTVITGSTRGHRSRKRPYSGTTVPWLKGPATLPIPVEVPRQTSPLFQDPEENARAPHLCYTHRSFPLPLVPLTLQPPDSSYQTSLLFGSRCARCVQCPQVVAVVNGPPPSIGPMHWVPTPASPPTRLHSPARVLYGPLKRRFPLI